MTNGMKIIKERLGINYLNIYTLKRNLYANNFLFGIIKDKVKSFHVLLINTIYLTVKYILNTSI